MDIINILLTSGYRKYTEMNISAHVNLFNQEFIGAVTNVMFLKQCVRGHVCGRKEAQLRPILVFCVRVSA